MPVPSFDWPSLIDAKDREIERLSQIYRRMLKDSGVELIEGDVYWHGRRMPEQTIGPGSNTISG